MIRNEVVGVTKIAILDDYAGVALEYGDWSALPDDAEITVYREAIPPERLVDELSDNEIVVITQQRARFPRTVLESLPKLKLLVCNGRTSNVVDHEARIERGIMLCGTAETSRGAKARPADYEASRGLPAPSEMAWALIFAVAKRTGIEDRVIRAGGWQTGFPVPLAGKTLGLLGAGRLGGAMVPVAKALGMDVVAWSQNLTEERCSELGVRKVTKAELLSSADVLGVFLVFSERSRSTLRADDLAKMKPGAILVNISRGPIVEEKALIEALRSGHLAGAGLDVFDREPLPRITPSGRLTTSSSPRTSATSPSTSSAPLGSAWRRTSRPTSPDPRSASSPTQPTARRWRRNRPGVSSRDAYRCAVGSVQSQRVDERRAAISGTGHATSSLVGMHTRPERSSDAGGDTLPEFPAVIDGAGSDVASAARTVRRRRAVRHR